MERELVVVEPTTKTIPLPMEIRSLPFPDWYSQWSEESGIRKANDLAWTEDLSGDDPATGWRIDEPLPESLAEFINDLDYFCPADAKILDIGCGNGRNVLELARRGAKVVGVDINRAGIKTTNDRLAKEGLCAQIEEMDFLDLRFPARSFHAILSVQVWQLAGCWRNARTAFFMAARLLKKGGYLALRVRSASNPRPRDHSRILSDDYGWEDNLIGIKGFNIINPTTQEIRHNYTRNELNFLANMNGLEYVFGPDQETNDPASSRQGHGCHRTWQWSAVLRKI